MLMPCKFLKWRFFFFIVWFAFHCLPNFLLSPDQGFSSSKTNWSYFHWFFKTIILTPYFTLGLKSFNKPLRFSLIHWIHCPCLSPTWNMNFEHDFLISNLVFHLFYLSNPKYASIYPHCLEFFFLNLWYFIYLKNLFNLFILIGG